MTADLSQGRHEEWVDSGWQSGLVRPLLIAILSACLVAGPLAVARAIFVEWSLDFVPPLCFLAGLMGVYTTRWLRRPAQRLLRRTAFRLSEAILLLVALRLATWLLTGDLPGLADARRWLLDPGAFFDGLYVTVALLALIAWERAGAAADIFRQLALAPDELAWRDEQRGGAWRRRMPVELVRVSRQALVNNFTNQWLGGGLILVFCAGISRLRVGQGVGLRLADLGLAPQLIAAVVAYFLIGLALTSQARLAVLRAQWLFEGVEELSAVPARWQRLSLAIILGVGLAATLLPLGSTWRAGEILGIVVAVVAQIGYAIVFSILALLAGLMSLLGLGRLPNEGTTASPAPVQPRPLVPEPMSGGLPPWLGGLGFWLVVVVIVSYSVAVVLGRRGVALNWATLRGALRRLGFWLGGRWQEARQLAGRLPIGLSGGRIAAGEGAGQARRPWRFIRLSALPPREKVRYFYLSTVRRAAEQGVVRRPSQTPLEFAGALEDAWPDAETDLEALTGAFVVARYDVAEIGGPQVKGVQRIWQRVKRALRRRRSASDRAEKGKVDNG